MSGGASKSGGDVTTGPLAVLRQPWLIGLVIVLALSVLVVVVLPWLSLFGTHAFASPALRAAIVVCLFAIWGLWLLIHHLNGGQDGAAAPLPSEEDQEKRRQQAQTLERRTAVWTRFERQMRVLRDHLPGRRNGQYAYHLPWFLVLGPDGSGKTTLLTRSEQDFPLSHLLDTDPLAPIVPTKDLSVWATNDAIYIDTPGALLGNGPDTDDEAGPLWDCTTALLNRFRGRRPINGAILVLSLESMILQSDHERAIEAQAIRHRLLGLMARVGTRFPIYVVLSKADMLAGFVEFFDDLRKLERGQIWGMSFDLPTGRSDDAAAWQEAFRTHYAALSSRLNDRVLKRLSEERDPERLALIQGFPQRFAGLRTMIGEMLAHIFLVDRYTTPPMLRGVYFTSAVQVGVPSDPLMGAISLSFDLERPPLPAHRSGPPFFTAALFQTIVVPEAGLATDNTHIERRKAWVHRLAYAGLFALVVGGGVAWWRGYQASATGLRDSLEQISTYQAFAVSPGTTLQTTALALDSLREVRDRYVPLDRTPVLGRLTLAPDPDLARLSRDAYATSLQADFAGRLAHQMEQRLRQLLSTDDEGALLDTLRIYLMLTQPDRRDPQIVSRGFDALWKEDPDTAGLHPSLMRHLNEWLAAEPALPSASPDRRLVSRVRHVLSQVPRAKRVYNALRSEGLSHLVGAVLVSRETGPLFHTVFQVRQDQGTGDASGNGIPRFFTAEGWETFFSPRATEMSYAALEDSWVVGDIGEGTLNDLDFREFQRAIGEHYMQDYVAQWRSLLDSLAVVQIGTLQDAVRTLEAMSGPSSPVRAVLDLVSRNTHLPLPVADDTGDTESTEDGGGGGAPPGVRLPGRARSAARIATTAMAYLPGGASGAEGAAALPPPGHLDATATVETFFAPLTDTLSGEPGATYYDSVSATLRDLYGFARDISEAVDPPATALEVVRTRAAGQTDDPITQLRQMAGSAPAPLRTWLNSIASATWASIIRTAETHLDTQWTTQVYAVWQQKIAGRYPIDRTADEDVALSDLGAFLGPGGTLDRFAQANISPFVDPETGRPLLIDGATLSIAPEALTQIRHARMLRDALFTVDGTIPQVTFELRPMQLDPTVARSMLMVDGQTLEYRHGPARMVRMHWPNADGPPHAEIRFQEVGPFGRILRQAADGPWAWFRLLDGAEITRADRHTRLIFTVSERQATYDLWVDRENSPFRLPELPGLQLPARL